MSDDMRLTAGKVPCCPQDCPCRAREREMRDMLRAAECELRLASEALADEAPYAAENKRKSADRIVRLLAATPEPQHVPSIVTGPPSNDPARYAGETLVEPQAAFPSSGRDYTKPEHDGELLRELGADGYKWADAFRQHFPNTGVDFGTLIGWFCNAVMAGADNRDAAPPSTHNPERTT